MSKNIEVSIGKKITVRHPLNKYKTLVHKHNKAWNILSHSKQHEYPGKY